MLKALCKHMKNIKETKKPKQNCKDEKYIKYKRKQNGTKIRLDITKEKINQLDGNEFIYIILGFCTFPCFIS